MRIRHLVFSRTQLLILALCLSGGKRPDENSKGGAGETSMSVAGICCAADSVSSLVHINVVTETNAMRAKLGMAPLAVRTHEEKVAELTARQKAADDAQ